MELFKNKHLFYALFVVLVSISLFFISLTTYFFKKASFVGVDILSQATITIKGEGKIFAVPDIATVTFTIEEQKDTATQAQQTLAEKSKNIIATLKSSFSIKEKDIKTTYYNVSPYYEWIYCGPNSSPDCRNKREQKGFKATQTIKLKIRDDKKAGEILTTLTNLGAKNVGGLQFEIEDKKELEQKARKLAIQDAKQKAQELANSLGVRLGRIVAYSEGKYNNPYPIYRKSVNLLAADMAAEPIAPEIPKGENEITYNVTIEFEIR